MFLKYPIVSTVSALAATNHDSKKAAKYILNSYISPLILASGKTDNISIYQLDRISKIFKDMVLRRSWDNLKYINGKSNLPEDYFIKMPTQIIEYIPFKLGLIQHSEYSKLFLKNIPTIKSLKVFYFL